MPASKPTSNAGVVVQTGHANYSNLTHCYVMMEGATSTTIDDHVGSADLTLTIDAAGGGFQTTTEPYSVAHEHNNGSGGSTYWTGSPTFDTTSNSFTVIGRFKCDSIDPTNNRPGSILGTVNEWGGSTPAGNQVGLFVMTDNTLHAVVGVGNAHKRTVTGEAYTPGTTGWVEFAMRYDYSDTTSETWNGVLTLFINGTSVGTKAGPGDRPGQWQNVRNDFASGKMKDASTESGWQGEFDVLYIYDAALSDTDISNIHNDIYAVIASASTPTSLPPMPRAMRHHLVR